ncbi:MAG: class I SAM-dependent methyltransferase [Candidatus Aminicenantales bacterium]
MRRIIEKLAHERQQRENEFSRKLEELKKRCSQAFLQKHPSHLQPLAADLDQALPVSRKTPAKGSSKLSSFLSSKKGKKMQPLSQPPARSILALLQDFENYVKQNLAQIKELILSLTEVIEAQGALMDAKDKEWDALGSNHVGMIFKSMQWRVDKLAAEYADVKILMKKFLLLKEKLNQLLTVLAAKQEPSPSQVKELLEPFEDWSYAGFENRFRGYGEEVKKQQEGYVSFFIQDKTVVDLGCGRGEFLELLREKGIKAEGIDLNQAMVETCLEKGLTCHQGDLLDKLAEYEDESLGGLFSSQVVEHLPSSYLKRLVELSYIKLAPSSYLIIETINPTSVFSFIQIYLLDLSHQKPIHPQALKFLLESSGFDQVEIKYSSPLEQEKLQEIPTTDDLTSALNQNIDKLNKFLYGPAHYAAIGHKGA